MYYTCDFGFGIKLQKIRYLRTYRSDHRNAFLIVLEQTYSSQMKTVTINPLIILLKDFNQVRCHIEFNMDEWKWGCEELTYSRTMARTVYSL